MSLKNILIIVWTGICTVASAVFFVLFEQEGKANRQLQEEMAKENERLQKEKADRLASVQKTYTKEMKKNEEITNNLNSSDAAAAIDNSNKLLQQVRESGRKRNNT